MKGLTVMKRLISAVLVLIISLCVYMPCTFAEEAANDAEDVVVTRLDVFKQMADIFSIKTDGDIMPLFSYNDWATIKGEDRYIVAAVIKSGIFAPDTASLNCNAPMTKEDYDRLTFGLTLYAMSNDEYNFISGKLTTVNRKGTTITDNHGGEYKFEDGISVIKGNEITDTFTGIATGLIAEVVYDNEGNGVIGWAKRSGAATAKYFYKGNLYVNDEINNSLIFNKLRMLNQDTWVTVNDLYLAGEICEETVVVLDGKKISVNDINTLYLDKPVSIIVGEKHGKQCILYVLFD